MRGQSVTATAPVVWRDSWEKARRDASAAGKPIVVVLRCARGSGNSSFDTMLDRADDTKLRAVLAECFIAVRLNDARSLDLSVFRYDDNRTFYALILTGDGRTLSRFCVERGDDPKAAIAAFTMWLIRFSAPLAPSRPTERRAVTLLDRYPAFRRTRAGSQPCFHCHYASDAAISAARREYRFVKSSLFRYPPPETLGLTLEPLTTEGIVRRIAPNAAASRAKLQMGDRLRRVNGMIVATAADFSSAIDSVSDRDARIAIEFVRAGKIGRVTLTTPVGWREYDISGRPSQGAVGPILGCWEERLTNGERHTLSLPQNALALRVTILFDGTKWASSRGDLRIGDILIAVDGKSMPDLTPSQFHTWFRLHKQVGQTAKFTVLRSNQRQELTIPCVDIPLE